MLCALPIDVNVPDDDSSRNLCDDDIGWGSVFVRCFILIFILSLSRLMLNDDRRRAFLSKPPILKISISSAFESLTMPSIDFRFNEHSLVDVPFWLAIFGLQTLSLSVFASPTEVFVLCTEIGGVCGSFSYSRTGKSFKFRIRDRLLVVLVPVAAIADAVVVRLVGDFVDDAAQRHLCDVLLLLLK